MCQAALETFSRRQRGEGGPSAATGREGGGAWPSAINVMRARWVPPLLQERGSGGEIRYPFTEPARMPRTK
jgi:hypothetical protein